jgi:2-oxoglutarate dehydrogenase E2 component (dihydrolipoamide succinyltransferase)
VAAAVAPVPEGAFFSPVVRKLAKDHGVDLGKVTGTGREGRITRKDVEAYVAAHGSAPPTAPTPAPPPPAPVAAGPPAAPSTPQPARPTASVDASEGVVAMDGDVVEDLNRIRSRIGENMTRSKQTAAHVWTSVEVDFERVERVRQAHKTEYKAREGHSLTYLPFIARATIDALNEFPVVNSSFYLEQKQAVYHSAINLGIAIDLNQEGLIVATIRNADGLRMVGLARSIRDLADRGRTNQLSIDDLSGSTFTITNPGPFGSFMSAPIINVPNVAILSTDTVTKRPTVVTSADGQDSIAIRHIAYLGLSWDHRAFDGSTAVLFLRRIKENIETWDWEQELD